MLQVSRLADLRDALATKKRAQIGFVPTMGALHAGHERLLREARQQNTCVITSIFVNPLQFAAHEDFGNYPQTLEADKDLCQKIGIDILFTPILQELYPLQEQTLVDPIPSLANCLCGKSRPHHFAGVLTIVTKLLNLVCPKNVYFGEKDYQQYLLIKRMVQDLNLPVNVLPVEIVRDDSGLALSSRNKYLSTSEKEEALVLFQTLMEAKNRIQGGLPPQKVVQDLWQTGFEYFEALDPETLQMTDEQPVRLFIAAQIGKARLIDNMLV